MRTRAGRILFLKARAQGTRSCAQAGSNSALTLRPGDLGRGPCWAVGAAMWVEIWSSYEKEATSQARGTSSASPPHHLCHRSPPSPAHVAMKTCMVSLFGAAGVIVGCSSCASAFAFPSNAALAKANAAPTRAAASAAAASTSNRRLFPRVMVRETALSAEKKDGEEQEPMDLDLEQMFEVSACWGCALHCSNHQTCIVWHRSAINRR